MDNEIVQIVRPHECAHESDVDEIENEPQPRAADVAAELTLTQCLVGENLTKETFGHVHCLQNFLATVMIRQTEADQAYRLFLLKV